jgi:hypothetical protein
MGEVIVVQRPKPPAGMPESQCVYWRVVVESLPADWFRPEQLPLLVQFCRHSAASDQIALMKEEAERLMLASEQATGGSARPNRRQVPPHRCGV